MNDYHYLEQPALTRDCILESKYGFLSKMYRTSGRLAVEILISGDVALIKSGREWLVLIDTEDVLNDTGVRLVTKYDFWSLMSIYENIEGRTENGTDNPISE